jgi:hypothetical protein
MSEGDVKPQVVVEAHNVDTFREQMPPSTPLPANIELVLTYS